MGVGEGRGDPFFGPEGSMHTAPMPCSKLENKVTTTSNICFFYPHLLYSKKRTAGRKSILLYIYLKHICKFVPCLLVSMVNRVICVSRCCSNHALYSLQKFSCWAGPARTDRQINRQIKTIGMQLEKTSTVRYRFAFFLIILY